MNNIKYLLLLISLSLTNCSIEYKYKASDIDKIEHNICKHWTEDRTNYLLCKIDFSVMRMKAVNGDLE